MDEKGIGEPREAHAGNPLVCHSFDVAGTRQHGVGNLVERVVLRCVRIDD
jgi:hypothetical protein